MILRRITGHLKQQHWTAIGIELAIVVLGVFIGLQVSNWNESRIEQARTALVLDAFRADMRDYIRVQQTFGEKVAKSLAAFDAARSRGERPAPYFMRFRGSDTAPKSVWEVAQQSGLAELVHPSLMFEIGYYYSEIDGIGVKFVRYSELVPAEHGATARVESRWRRDCGFSRVPVEAVRGARACWTILPPALQRFRRQAAGQMIFRQINLPPSPARPGVAKS